MNVGTLNLGSGGKGPGYFLRRPELLAEANTCKLAVVQVMAAKGSESSLFRSINGGDTGLRADTGARARSLGILRDLESQGHRRYANRLIREMQRSYVNNMITLLEAITIPTILFYISFHTPPRAFPGAHRNALNGFPQLVNRRMLGRVKPHADRFVELVSTAGVPQVISDEEGNTVKVNKYYPSPEMHALAAARLTPVIEELMTGRVSGGSRAAF